MPYAEHETSAEAWATERAITCWAWFSADLSQRSLQALRDTAAESRADGATWALVVPDGRMPSDGERKLADVTVAGAAAPAPWGLFAAMQPPGSRTCGGWA